MADVQRLTTPVIIELPREIDAANAEQAAEPLRAACMPGAIVIADMAKTIFCDSRGTNELLNAHFWAKAAGCGLRFARPSPEVLHVWLLLGADQILAMYPTLDAAMALTETKTKRRGLAGLRYIIRLRAARAR